MTYSGMRWGRECKSLFGTGDLDVCAIGEDLRWSIVYNTPRMPWERFDWQWDDAVDDDVEYLQRGRHDV